MMKRLLAFTAVAALAGLLIAPGALALDTFEPNDTPETAHAIEFPAELQSYISTENDVDIYKVWLEPGPIRIVMTPPASYGCAVQLRSSENAASNSYSTALAIGYDRTEGTPVEVTYSVTEAGFYYVAVTGYDGSFSFVDRSRYDYENPYRLLFDGQGIGKLPTELGLVAPGTVDSGTVVRFLSMLTCDEYPLSGKPIRLERSSDGITGWSTVAELTSDTEYVGHDVTPTSTMWYRLVFDGDATFRGSVGTAYKVVVDAGPGDPGSALRIISVAGGTRYDTAVAASLEAYPDGLDPDGERTVIIATGRNWPDALGGTALAGVLNGPILLVDTNSVPAAVMAEITRLGATKAIILGGPSAVGAPVESALKTKFGNANVTRIAGGSRYSTADQVAARTIELLGETYDGTAFVATGGKFPDALAAAPLAAAKGWPLFLAHPTEGLLPDTVTAMGSVSRALILGGEDVVSPSVYSRLRSAYGSANVVRLAGPSRYDTAAAVAAYGVANAELYWDRVGIATGQKFPDALAGGVLQGRMRSVMLLTRSTSLETATRDALAANSTRISAVTFFGSTGAVSQSVRDAVEHALQ